MATRFGSQRLPGSASSTSRPSCSRTDLKAGRLLPIVLDQPLFQFANAYAVYAPTRYVPAKVRRFIDFLAERWAGEPPWDAGLPPEVIGG